MQRKRYLTPLTWPAISFAAMILLGTLALCLPVCHGEGAFTGAPKTLILTVTTPAQAVLLRRYVREIDPESFIFITNTSEIIGKGFRYTHN